jgi:hypothetical protein
MSQNQRVEIILRKATFDDGTFHELTFLVIIEGRKKSLMWSVASRGTSFRPVVFYNSFDEAHEEFARCCGISSLINKKLLTNEKFGEIKGYYGPQKRGFRVKNKYQAPTVELKSDD